MFGQGLNEWEKVGEEKETPGGGEIGQNKRRTDGGPVLRKGDGRGDRIEF